MTSPAGAHAPHPAVAHLRTQWAAQAAPDALAAWTVLDTDFNTARTFLDIWQCWRSQAHKPHMLHYVGVLSAEQAAQLVQALQTPHATPLPALAATLATDCYGLGDGFHRILLEDGQISLTLCLGELIGVLAQQEMQAHTIVAGTDAAHWDKWALKALARHCRRGSTVVFGDAWPQVDLLLSAGFAVPAYGAQPESAVFDPRWTLRTTRRNSTAAPSETGRCAVIGAGIAGASVARALAVRGWQVDVLDASAHPAGGASGLPVGLVVPHHSADDSPRSRMSRVGTRLMLQHARQRLRQGQDWNPGGVMELDIATEQLDAVEAEVHSQTEGAHSDTGWASAARLGDASGLWHPHAAWIKPARLVAQWLAHPNIQFHGQACVHTLERSGAQWQLLAGDGRALATADRVVFANAYASAALLHRIKANTDTAWAPDVPEKLQALQALQGTLSLGRMKSEASNAWPAFPVNGHGSFVSGVPTEQGPHWYAGSTFHNTLAAPADVPGEHAANLKKLQALLPQVAQDLAGQFEQQEVQAWQGTRCVTHDRLPLVGPLEDVAQPTLWMSVGMGARGLSFSALCAELLAAWLGGEPLPIENNRAKGLSSRRLRRQRG